MRLQKTIAVISLALAGIGSGCRDNTPAPSRVPVPAAGQQNTAFKENDRPRPLDMSAQPEMGDPRAYNDEPLVVQPPPEQRAFIDAYNRIGRPRMTLFVNRTMEGSLIPVNPPDPLVSVEHSRQSTTGVTVERKTYGRKDTYKSNGPAEYREKTDVYLKPGQYDEVQAKSLDYEAVENIMSDWLAANGQTVMISPTLARQRLTDQQVKDLQSGRPVVLSEIAQQLGADVLVQVQAHPTRQTPQGLEVRVIAEAMNIKGGQSIGRAVVDVPPPLEKTQINKYTRFLVRKLMDDMTGSWGAMAMGEMKSPLPPVNPPNVPEKPAPPPGDQPKPPNVPEKPVEPSPAPPKDPPPAPDKPVPAPPPPPPTPAPPPSQPG